MITRENLKLVAVAAVCLTVGLAGPSVAGAVQQGLNADQVDGKHAVGAKAPVAKRKNKLVATNKAGYLPDNIVRGQAGLRRVAVPAYAIDGTSVDLFGVNLPDAASHTAIFSFTLPPSYRRGTPVSLDVTYVKNGGATCKASLGTLGDRFSPGTDLFGTVNWDFANGQGVGAITLPGQVGNLHIKLGLVPIAPIEAGDTLRIRILRFGNDGTDDTCTGGAIYIVGAVARF